MNKTKLPASAAPFQEGAFSGTKWTNRFFMADYDLYLENEAAALVAIQHLAAHFRNANWIAKEGVDGADGPIFDRSPGAGDVSFYSERGGMEGPNRIGVRVSLDHLGGWVTFECTCMPLIMVQVQEALGHFSEGTPRPERPV